MATLLDLEIQKGDTYSPVIRWAVLPFIYKAITAIANTAPVRITAAGHGLASGWPAAVVSAQGMKEINASSPPKDDEYLPVTIVDGNTVEFNTVNASLFSKYTSGGYLQYYTPAPLSGRTARMQVKDKDGNVLLALTSDNGRILLDDTNHTITLLLTAAETAAITWKHGAYDLEVANSDTPETVTKLYYGTVFLNNEITT